MTVARLLKAVRMTNPNGVKYRIRFYRTRAYIDVWCDICKNWTCKSEYYECSKQEVARALKVTRTNDDVVIGCQRFKGRSAAVTYARQWVKRG